MILYSTDTIAAFATPPGAGGIAVLRISGPDALKVLRSLFVPSRSADSCPADSHAAARRSATFPSDAPEAPLSPPAPRPFPFRPRYMHHGFAASAGGERIDEVLAVFMPGPASATGEDVGEIHCHGGPGVTSALLEAAFAAGARLAAPGEFTRRAFLNGRMDLTQAEAVAELIAAPTAQGARLAGAKLEGALGRRVAAIRGALDDLRVQLTLAVDFPDEEAELLPPEGFRATVKRARADVALLLTAFERARLWREGAAAVLAGRVNAGKSSLLNALLGRERAIVSAAPGTTRDYLEETVQIEGMPLRLVDTAGLRRGGDIVEAEGMRRARELADGADLILLVVDATAGLSDEDRDFLEANRGRARRGGLLLVYNKADALDREQAGQLPHAAGKPEAERTGELPRKAGKPAAGPSGGPEGDPPGALADAGAGGFPPVFLVSAREGTGLAELGRGIRRALLGGGDTAPVLPEARHALHTPEAKNVTAGERSQHLADPAGGDAAPNLRQSLLLRKAGEELAALAEDFKNALPPDILTVRVDAAVELLDEVTGSSATEEILDRIFASFCIGK